MGFLEQNTEIPPRHIHEYLKLYKIDGKSIFVVRDGKNANFSTKSCPASSMDLIHAETLTCIKSIMNGKHDPNQKIHETSHQQRTALMKSHNKIWNT
jgi:S-adenosylhomocysteine hydrolase